MAVKRLSTRKTPLTLTWVPVRDAHGQTRMEMRWNLAEAPASRRVSAA